MSALDLIYERIRTHIAPYGVSFEHKIVNADPTTSYIFIARAGTPTSAAKWIIWRIKQSGNSVTNRMARTSATAEDQEQFNKVADTPEIYDYVE